MNISSNDVVITRVAGAIYGEVLSYGQMQECLTFANAQGYDAWISSVVGRDFPTAASIATAMATNALAGAPSGTVNAAIAWITGQLTAAGQAHWGSTISAIVNAFATTPDSSVAAYSAAFELKVSAALVYSETPGNAVTFPWAQLATGQTYDLTLGIDQKTGTAGNDTFNATAQASSAPFVVQTLGNSDQLDGGAGVNTLNADLVASVTPGLLHNIQNVNVTQAATYATGSTLNLLNADAVANIAAKSFIDTTLNITNLSTKLTSIGLQGTSGSTVDIDSIGSALSGARDSLTVNLSATDAYLNLHDASNGVYETIAITSTGLLDNTLNISGGAAQATTINVSGTTNLDLNQDVTSLNMDTLRTFNASGLAANLNVDFTGDANGATVNVTGATGDNTIDFDFNNGSASNGILNITTTAGDDSVYFSGNSSADTAYNITANVGAGDNNVYIDENTGNVAVTATTGSNDIDVEYVTGNVALTVGNGDNTNVSMYEAINVGGSLRITAGNGNNDYLGVMDSYVGDNGTITVTAGTGNNAYVEISGSSGGTGSAFSIVVGNGNNGGDYAGDGNWGSSGGVSITDSDAGTLSINAGDGVNSVGIIDSTADTTITLTAGNGANADLVVSGSTAGTSINVTAGNGDNDWISVENSDANSSINVTAGNGANDVNMHTVTATAINLTLGGGNNTFTGYDVYADTFTATLGAGNNDFYLGDLEVQDVVVSAGNGNNTITVSGGSDDYGYYGADTVTVTAGTGSNWIEVGSLGSASAVTVNVGNTTAGNGDNYIAVYGSSSNPGEGYGYGGDDLMGDVTYGTVVTVNGGTGNDWISVSTTNPVSALANHDHFDGGAGTNVLEISSGEAWSDTVDMLNVGSVGIENIGTIVDTSNGYDNTFNFDMTYAGSATSLVLAGSDQYGTHYSGSTLDVFNLTDNMTVTAAWGSSHDSVYLQLEKDHAANDTFNLTIGDGASATYDPTNISMGNGLTTINYIDFYAPGSYMTLNLTSAGEYNGGATANEILDINGLWDDSQVNISGAANLTIGTIEAWSGSGSTFDAHTLTGNLHIAVEGSYDNTVIGGSGNDLVYVSYVDNYDSLNINLSAGGTDVVAINNTSDYYGDNLGEGVFITGFDVLNDSLNLVSDAETTTDYTVLSTDSLVTRHVQVGDTVNLQTTDVNFIKFDTVTTVAGSDDAWDVYQEALGSGQIYVDSYADSILASAYDATTGMAVVFQIQNSWTWSGGSDYSQAYVLNTGDTVRLVAQISMTEAAYAIFGTHGLSFADVSL
jgi:hypothetical protein